MISKLGFPAMPSSSSTSSDISTVDTSSAASAAAGAARFLLLPAAGAPPPPPPPFFFFFFPSSGFGGTVPALGVSDWSCSITLMRSFAIIATAPRLAVCRCGATPCGWRTQRDSGAPLKHTHVPVTAASTTTRSMREGGTIPRPRGALNLASSARPCLGRASLSPT